MFLRDGRKDRRTEAEEERGGAGRRSKMRRKEGRSARAHSISPARLRGWRWQQIGEGGLTSENSASKA